MIKTIDCQQLIDGQILCYMQIPDPAYTYFSENTIGIATVVAPVFAMAALIGLVFAVWQIKLSKQIAQKEEVRQNSKDYADATESVTLSIIDILDELKNRLEFIRNSGTLNVYLPAYNDAFNLYSSELSSVITQYKEYSGNITQDSHKTVIEDAHRKISSKVSDIKNYVLSLTDGCNDLFKNKIEELLIGGVIRAPRQVGIVKQLTLTASSKIDVSIDTI